LLAGEIARLVGLLDDGSTGIADDAKAELVSSGPEVVQQLSSAVGTLGSYRQLSVVEVTATACSSSAVSG
jgi:hypothetical protein